MSDAEGDALWRRSPALLCTSVASVSSKQGCSYMTEDLLTWPGRGSTFENGPGALSSDCAMVGHRDSLWPGSFSHTVAQRERSVPTGEDSQASWGSVRRGVYAHHRGWLSSIALGNRLPSPPGCFQQPPGRPGTSVSCMLPESGGTRACELTLGLKEPECAAGPPSLSAPPASSQR